MSMKTIELTPKAIKNLKDYDLYVKIIININDDIEFQICNNSDNMVLCSDIYTLRTLIKTLGEWGGSLCKNLFL